MCALEGPPKVACCLEYFVVVVDGVIAVVGMVALVEILVVLLV